MSHVRCSRVALIAAISMLAAAVGRAQTELPDLLVASVDDMGLTTDPQTLWASGTVVAKLMNVGGAAAPAGYHVLFFADGNGNGRFEADTDSVLAERTLSSELAPRDTIAVSAEIGATVRFAGELVYALADAGEQVVESDETNNVGNSGSDCEYRPPAGAFDPVLEWAWTGSSVEPTALNVMMTPAVVDLNRDGMPDVVFASTASTGGGQVEVGVLRALDGADGAELFTVTDPAIRVSTTSSVAAGDLDGDGRIEIVASDSTGSRLLAFSNTGTLKWRSPVLESIIWGAPAIANLDGTGPAEVVLGRQVLDGASGAIRWSGTGGRGGQGIGSLSLVADVDLDGEPEVVAGNTVYEADGSILWRNASAPDGYDAVGNFDADAFPEIVIVAGGTVRLLEHDGTLKWGPFPIPGGGAGGPPTIADYDGDGQREIGVAGATRYAVFETDGTLKWAAVTQDNSSNRTGSSVFDFEGDGAAEVVYHDELKLRVYRGKDGAVLFQTPASSCTWHEYPVIADVDADGNAEIVSVANNSCNLGTQRGVFVYGDRLDRWVSTRRIWNQHTYHVTNVRDDGSIPLLELDNWRQRRLNNYRTQKESDGNPFASPDLTASLLRWDGSSCPEATSLVARLGNAGANVAASPVKVAFYDGDPASGGTLLGVTSSSVDLQPGQFQDVTLVRSTDISGPHTICAVADDDGAGKGATSECNETNNKVCTTIDLACNRPPVASCAASEVCNDPGLCTASPVCDGGVGSCSDPDGDSLRLTCQPPSPYSLGTTNVAVGCSDGQGGFSDVLCPLTVKDCEAPVCQAPPALAFECNAPGGVSRSDPAIQAWLAAASARDNCGSVASFTNDAPAFFPLGTTLVTWATTDAAGHTSRCSSSVRVADTTPPAVVFDLAKSCLWPPNHKLVDVGGLRVVDACDPQAAARASLLVSSDEPTASIVGAGGGTHCPDAAVLNGRVSLRAERTGTSGKDNGRVYVITVVSTDAAGNTVRLRVPSGEAGCPGSVCVPHDQNPKTAVPAPDKCPSGCPAVDDGQSYDAFVCQ